MQWYRLSKERFYLLRINKISQGEVEQNQEDI